MDWKNIKVMIRDKAVTIIIIGMLAAVCAAGAKYLFTPDISLKGDFIYSRVIKIKDPDKPGFDYVGVAVGNASYFNFIQNTDNSVFDYSKIYSNWNRIDDRKKIEWLQRSIRIRGYQDNTFEFSYLIPSTNISDLPYLEQHAAEWMDSYMRNAEQMIQKARSRATIQTVKSSFISPKVIKNDKKSIIVKNAVYGFIAGIFLATAAFISKKVGAL